MKPRTDDLRGTIRINLQKVIDAPEEALLIAAHEYEHVAHTDHISNLEDSTVADSYGITTDEASTYQIGFYFSKTMERLAFKRELDIYMEKEGVKTYDQAFTEEHAAELMDRLKENRLPPLLQSFLRTVKPEALIHLFNDIAYHEDDQELFDSTSSS